MDADPPKIIDGCDPEATAWRMIERGQASIAVVDADGRFGGLISPHAMVSALLAEHDESLARLGGYLAGSRRARQAAQENVTRRLWHRLPWLIVGLAGAMLSVAIVSGFERELNAEVLLAFFLPAVIYMADAVGTQTEAILIRAMSAGVTVRSVFVRELATGAILGGLVGVTFLVFALATFGDTQIAVAVAVALFASCSIASVIAMTLPWALAKAGRDPAFGAGPLATVIQDLLSIVVYFAVATAIAV
jgi:magnesium transporter